MNYKKIFKTRASRSRMLKLLRFVPDKPMVKLQYRIKTGRRLHLKNPKRFTEKLQWYKLYYRDQSMIQCVDKYDVRSFVKERGLERILNDCYGVFSQAEEIDFSFLPDRFVMKDTLGGGSNSVLVVRNKNTITEDKLRARARAWLNKPWRKKNSGREWPYYSGKPRRVILEKYLDGENGDLIDYKFFCFDGVVKYYYIRTGYSKNHNAGEIAFYTRESKYLPGVGMDYCNTAKQELRVPPNIDEMISMAEILSKGFPHVRVDLYNIYGTIVFGELTFFNASGYMLFSPDSFDLEMGECFHLPPKKTDKD